MKTAIIAVLCVFSPLILAGEIRFREENGFLKIIETPGKKIYKFGADAEKITYIKSRVINSIQLLIIEDQLNLVITTEELVAKENSNENRTYYFPVEDFKEIHRAIDNVLGQLDLDKGR